MVDFSANRKRTHIQVTGMSCSSCVAKIERQLGQKRGGPRVLSRVIKFDMGGQGMFDGNLLVNSVYVYYTAAHTL